MKKDDYIELITVAEGLKQFEDGMRALGVSPGDYGPDTVAGKLIKVINVLSRNAAPEYDFITPDKDCSEQFHGFHEILENDELSAEEKYNILTGGKDA